MDRVSKTEINSNLFCWPKRVSCCNNIASYDDNIVVFWQFFSAGDYRLTDNRTIIISRSPFRSWTGHPLPPSSWYPVSSLFTLPDRRSFHLYFGTLATLTREFPWLRYPPGGEPIGFCLLHLSLVSSHSFFLPPFLSLSHSFSLSLLAAHRRFCLRSLSSTRYRRLVHQSDAIMTSGENEKRTQQNRLHLWLHIALIDRSSRRSNICANVTHFYIRRFVESKISFTNRYSGVAKISSIRFVKIIAIITKLHLHLKHA